MNASARAEVVATEVAEARYLEFVADLLGRGLQTTDAASAASAAEAAAERACIVAEGAGICVGVGGLVSLPTSQTERAERRMRQGAARLRAVLKATESDQYRARLGRMRRSVGFSARAIQASALAARGFRPDYAVMVTLTYRADAPWSPKHVAKFLDAARHYQARLGRSLRYVWVGELQQRGALHYHVVIWLPHGETLPKPDKRGWWPHGSTRIEAARDAVPYLLKYLSKGTEMSQLPKGARMHGSGGVEHALRRARRWLAYPAWIKARADITDDWRPARGGGWSDPEGTVIPSEHVRAWLGDRWGALRVADYGRPFDAAGPFSWIPYMRA